MDRFLLCNCYPWLGSIWVKKEVKELRELIGLHIKMILKVMKGKI